MTCPSDAANDTPCTCNLLEPPSRFGHFADDVVHIVYEAILDVRSEQPAGDGLSFTGACRALLDEGLEGWKAPTRQAHRPDEWREACLAELRGYLAQR